MKSQPTQLLLIFCLADFFPSHLKPDLGVCNVELPPCHMREMLGAKMAVLNLSLLNRGHEQICSHDL